MKAKLHFDILTQRGLEQPSLHVRGLYWKIWLVSPAVIETVVGHWEMLLKKRR